MLGLRHYEPHFDWWIFALSPGIAVIDQLLRRYRRSEATTHLASRSGRARLRADRRRRQHTGRAGSRPRRYSKGALRLALGAGAAVIVSDYR